MRREAPEASLTTTSPVTSERANPATGRGPAGFTRRLHVGAREGGEYPTKALEGYPLVARELGGALSQQGIEGLLFRPGHADRLPLDDLLE